MLYMFKTFVSLLSGHAWYIRVAFARNSFTLRRLYAVGDSIISHSKRLYTKVTIRTGFSRTVPRIRHVEE